jgi:hypothetical protein
MLDQPLKLETKEQPQSIRDLHETLLSLVPEDMPAEDISFDEIHGQVVQPLLTRLQGMGSLSKGDEGDERWLGRLCTHLNMIFLAIKDRANIAGLLDDYTSITSLLERKFESIESIKALSADCRTAIRHLLHVP